MTSARRLVLATANPHKASEISAVLVGWTLEPRPGQVEEVIEDGETLEDNARLKARALLAATGVAAVADDTGLEVEALGGAPGVHSARYSGPGATAESNVAALLTALDGVPEPRRRARFRTVALVAFPDGSEVVADGTVSGRITTEARGGGGFGYDPVFVPDEDPAGRTFAQMDAEAKNAISHRGRAFRRLAELLDGRG